MNDQLKQHLLTQLLDEDDMYIIPQDIDFEVLRDPSILKDDKRFEEFLSKFDIQHNLFLKEQLLKYRYYPYQIPETKQEKLNFVKSICMANDKLQQHQRFLPKIINPTSPMKALLVFHNVGTGKTLTAISIAETFRENSQSFDGKIFVIIPGPLQRDSWENDLVQFVGPKITAQPQENRKLVLNKLHETYKIYTRKSFVDNISAGLQFQQEQEELARNQFQQSDNINQDLIASKLDDALVIIDEVHSFVGTSYSQVFMDVLKRSKNVKLVMLSATPIKNKVDDILEIMNFICLIKGKTLYRKTDLFEYGKYVDEIKLRPDKENALQAAFQGYVSYFFNNIPYVFPTRITHGTQIKTIGHGVHAEETLIYSRIGQCVVESFQKWCYDGVKEKRKEDLGITNTIVSNITIPVMNKDVFGFVASITAFKQLLRQLYTETGRKNIQKNLLAIIKEPRFEEDIENMIVVDEQPKGKLPVRGKMFSKEYLRHFSTKLRTLYEDMQDSYNAELRDRILALHEKRQTNQGRSANKRKRHNNNNDTKGESLAGGANKVTDDEAEYNTLVDELANSTFDHHSRSIFIYSNYKTFGVDVIERMLLENGYQQFSPTSTYPTHAGATDAITGLPYLIFQDLNLQQYFNFACYIKVSGGGEEGQDTEMSAEEKKNAQKDSKRELQETKQYIYSTYNNPKNIDGRLIKILLGSKVTNEGITFSNVGQCHIFDNSFNMSKINQINGRVIRYCQHRNKQIILQEPEQVVHLFRYAAAEIKWEDAMKKKQEYTLSLEENMIRKSEQKYIEMTKVHKLLKVNAIDCPFFYDLNINKKLIELYKGCKEIYLTRQDPKLCPIECDFTSCDFKCSSKNLDKYYDARALTYQSSNIVKESKRKKRNKKAENVLTQLQRDLFFKDQEVTELNEYKNCIRKIFKKGQQYTYSQIVQEVIKQLDVYQKQNLNNYYLVYALNAFAFKDVNTISVQKDFLTNFLGELGFLIIDRVQQRADRNVDKDRTGVSAVAGENVYIFKSIQELQSQNMDQLLTIENNNKDLNLLFDNTAIITPLQEQEDTEYFYNQEYIRQKPKSFFQAIVMQRVRRNVEYEEREIEIKFGIEDRRPAKRKSKKSSSSKSKSQTEIQIAKGQQIIGKKYTKNIKHEERQNKRKRKKKTFDNEQSITASFPGKNLNNFLLQDFAVLFEKLRAGFDDVERETFEDVKRRIDLLYKVKNDASDDVKNSVRNKQYYKDVITKFLIMLEVRSTDNLYLIVPTNHEYFPFPLNKQDLLKRVQEKMYEIQSLLGLRDSFVVAEGEDDEIQIILSMNALEVYIGSNIFDEFAQQVHMVQRGEVFYINLIPK